MPSSRAGDRRSDTGIPAVPSAGDRRLDTDIPTVPTVGNRRLDTGTYNRRSDTGIPTTEDRRAGHRRQSCCA